MMKTFTQQHLSQKKSVIEITADDNNLITPLITTEQTLIEEYDNLDLIKEVLNQLLTEPNKNTIEAILKYSNATR